MLSDMPTLIRQTEIFGDEPNFAVIYVDVSILLKPIHSGFPSVGCVLCGQLSDEMSAQSFQFHDPISAAFRPPNACWVLFANAIPLQLSERLYGYLCILAGLLSLGILDVIIFSFVDGHCGDIIAILIFT